MKKPFGTPRTRGAGAETGAMRGHADGGKQVQKKKGKVERGAYGRITCIYPGAGETKVRGEGKSDSRINGEELFGEDSLKTRGTVRLFLTKIGCVKKRAGGRNTANLGGTAAEGTDGR